MVESQVVEVVDLVEVEVEPWVEAEVEVVEAWVDWEMGGRLDNTLAVAGSFYISENILILILKVETQKVKILSHS